MLRTPSLYQRECPKFHRRRFRTCNVRVIESSLQNLTQDELIARLEYHMGKVQYWAEQEEVARLNKQSHALAVRKAQDMIDPSVEPTWMQRRSQRVVDDHIHSADTVKDSSSDDDEHPVVVSGDQPSPKAVSFTIPHEIVEFEDDPIWFDADVQCVMDQEDTLTEDLQEDSMDDVVVPPCNAEKKIVNSKKRVVKKRCSVLGCKKGSIYLPTYIPTYQPTYLPIYIPTYLLTYLLTYLPTYLLTYLTT